MFVDEGTTHADSALRHHGLDGHGRQAGNNREIHSDDTNVLLRQIEVGLILSPLLWRQGACLFVLSCLIFLISLVGNLTLISK